MTHENNHTNKKLRKCSNITLDEMRIDNVMEMILIVIINKLKVKLGDIICWWIRYKSFVIKYR